jgi:hypothetical protein
VSGVGRSSDRMLSFSAIQACSVDGSGDHEKKDCTREKIGYCHGSYQFAFTVCRKSPLLSLPKGGKGDYECTLLSVPCAKSLRSMSLQVLNNLEPVSGRSNAQSRSAFVVLCIDVSSLIDEEPHDLEIFRLGCCHEGRSPVFALCIDIGSLIDQESHDFGISSPDSGHEGG